jgi:predicted porin
MKKSLLALAVAAALPAVAQAQSSVTLYGIVDASVEWSNAAANSAAAAGGNNAITGKSTIRVNSGHWNSSRLGVRGVEPLGNSGMSAIFAIEHRFQVDTGAIQSGQAVGTAPYTGLQAGSFWNGTAWGGLRTGMGDITLGRQYTPAFYAMYFPDWTLNSGYNNWAAPGVATTVAATGTSAIYGLVRADNSVMWTSPTIGGLQVRAMWAPGALAYNSTEVVNAANVARSNGSGDLHALSGVWRMGKLLVTGSYQKFDTQTAHQDGWTVAAGYDFGAFGLTLGYSDLSFATYDVTSKLLSAYVKVGASGKVYANVSQIDQSTTGDGVQIGLTYVQDLSNRTAIYAGFGRNDNSGYGTGLGNESGKNRVSIGLRHNF